MTDIETIVSLAKRRGFAFPSSDVYGGLGSVWDYGPNGVELKNNVKRAWWRSVVYERDDVVGLDAGILMNRLAWKYSGHEATFSDPLVDCRKCKARLRADKIEDGKCPECGSADLTEPRQFNLMFRTTIGPVEDDSGLPAYLARFAVTVSNRMPRSTAGALTLGFSRSGPMIVNPSAL